jgi:serine/threonine protein kinase
MGVVYEARHLKLGRTVALKMILAGGHAGTEMLDRFRAEAEAVARMQHPNIVQIFEVGEQNGLPFFSLEYCGGGSLEKRLGGNPMPSEDAARLIATLARAVQAAHDKGIVHRDLKPANVLFAEDGSPKVTDFGIAKKLDAEAHTADGSLLGTPSYMSPEQAAGNCSAVGPPSDIHALGAILYECLTGRPPFKAATPLDTIMLVANEDPVSPRRLLACIPSDLETVCLKCLRKEPGRRYESAAALADDLGRYLGGEPILARPVGAPERLWRWCLRNPVVSSLAALVALLLLASAVSLRVSFISTERLARHSHGLALHNQQLARSGQRLLAESLAGRLDERLRSDARAARMLGRMAEVRALLAAPSGRRADLAPAARSAVEAMAQSNPDFASAFVLDGAGAVAVSTSATHRIGHSFAFRDYFREALAGKQFRSKVIIGTTTKVPGMYISSPVPGPDEKPVGVAVVKMAARSIWEIVDALKVGDGGSVFVLDEDGIVVADQDAGRLFHAVGAVDADTLRRVSPRERFQSDTVPSLGLPVLAALPRPASSGLLDHVKGEGSQRVAAYAGLKEVPWVAVIDVDGPPLPEPPAPHPWRDVPAALLAVAAVSLVGALVLRWLRARGAGKASGAA